MIFGVTFIDVKVFELSDVVRKIVAIVLHLYYKDIKSIWRREILYRFMMKM